MAHEKRWHDVIAISELEIGDVTPTRLGKRELAVYDGPDGIYVSVAHCSHSGADLRDGYFDGYIIECPLHQGCFDIRDGSPKGAPVTRPMKVFETQVVAGMVQILI